MQRQGGTVKQALKGVLLFGSLAAVVLMFQNCGQSTFNAVQGSDFGSFTGNSEFNPLVRECVANVSQKMFFAQAPSKMAEDLVTVNLNPETQLLAVVDNQCLEKQAGNELRKIIFATQQPVQHLAQSSYELSLDRTFSYEELAQLAEADPCVLKIDLNVQMKLFQVAGGDPRVANQKHLETIEHAAIYNNLFNLNNGINSVVRVAVIDSGIDMNHPDLKDAIMKDSSGRAIGYNAINNTTEFSDSGFHGTHVAGLIGATSHNEVAGRGVLGRSIRILPIKVSPDGSSVDLNAVINGIRWAADQGAEVINMSLGGRVDRPAYREAIQYAIDKGSFIVVASGNDGQQLGVGINTYPAMYSKDFAGMITVGSIDATTKSMSGFSNYSTTFVDIMAPGSDGSSGILSTVPTAQSSTGMAASTSVGPIQGTSMAAPVASGAAAVVYALAKSRGYRPSPDQVEIMMLKSAEVLANLNTRVKGGKNLNLKKLVEAMDQDMGLNISSTVSRNRAVGPVRFKTQPTEQQVLVNSSVNFVADPSDDSAVFLNYQWYKNDKPLVNETKRVLSLKNINFDAAATYHVVMSAGTAQVSSQKANLIVGRSICP